MSSDSPGCSLIKNRFRIIENIGQGAYGSVYKALDLLNNKIVALKTVKIFDHKQSMPVSFFRELKVLQSIKDSHIIQYFETIRSNDSTFISMECCDTDLQKQLSSRYRLSFIQIKSLMKQLLQGLNTLHSNGFAHRDIKPANILLKGGSQLKIADLGLSKQILNQRLTSKVCALAYRAPELILGSKDYTFSVDIWSAGVIFYELLTGLPFPAAGSEIGQIDKIFQLTGTPNNSETNSNEDIKLFNFYCQLPNWNITSMLSSHTRTLEQFLEKLIPLEMQEAIPILLEMLSLNPEKRPSASQLLQYDFFSFDEEAIPKIPHPEIKVVEQRCITPPYVHRPAPILLVCN
ncbi:CMGC family protein kinase [Trichomonas vaginalis G3]|uniref:CMGC family protein kinase n=1 Tax=Trichomonas vaginalis (strain ATCC PRA-98 / G3) TaxID=412133 RepID=A2E3X6_TRIV3|nr:cyclin-dependent protein serine/threonine kinase protein [Trichomonas vaginalis G3]EAY12631.1 CMGC family protein kinase [Trichomonas vaginalis G3]KAI5546992.1 cyclin-dependent protein serine/threonine kinase protein [Trichomonas vaginalis G3]|eukprot:XP_001324854.1 CMGC family protein kinase [Trichomonas vaginalis G3]